jgi:hypothetical protein
MMMERGREEGSRTGGGLGGSFADGLACWGQSAPPHVVVVE